MVTNKIKKYLIKKNNTDLISSLNQINKKIIDSYLKEFDLNDINELKKFILESFEGLLEISSDDFLTLNFFERLVQNENSIIFSAFESDLENFYVFAYDKGEYYSYYIPDEIKKIIMKKFKI